MLFCNENDRPYLLEAPPVHVAAMARIVGELAPEECPFGVDYLWDARAALGVAVARGAAFMREVLPGVYESDMGLWEPDAGALLRERRAYGADDLCVLMNVTPEFASPLGSRPRGVRARSAVVSSLADAILVSGPMAGAEPALEAVREVADARRRAARRSLLNTGARAANDRRRSRRSSTASSSAATSSATATPGPRSSASGCAASWTPCGAPERRRCCSASISARPR